MDGGKSATEEIIRQLWVYKLVHQYGYHADEIDLEKSVHFGTEVGTKAADLEIQKLAYFLQESGMDLKLRYGCDGPLE